MNTHTSDLVLSFVADSAENFIFAACGFFFHFTVSVSHSLDLFICNVKAASAFAWYSWLSQKQLDYKQLLLINRILRVPARNSFVVACRDLSKKYFAQTHNALLKTWGRCFHTKGDKRHHEPTNDIRPISLTSFVLKSLEQVLKIYLRKIMGRPHFSAHTYMDNPPRSFH